MREEATIQTYSLQNLQALAGKISFKNKEYTGHEDIRLEIPPEVFHPGFFFSTKYYCNISAIGPLQESEFWNWEQVADLLSIYARKESDRYCHRYQSCGN